MTIDPLARWRPLPDKPDYAGFLSFGGAPIAQEPAHLEGVDVAIVGAPMDDLVSRPSWDALRAAGDPRGVVPAGPAPRSRRRRVR
jgi:agmatinase